MSDTLVDLAAALASLEQQVRELRISVDRAIAESSEAQTSIAADTQRSTGITQDWLNQVAGANSREELAQLDWTPLAELVRTCRLTAAGEWTAELRIARAFREGYLGRCAIHIGATQVPHPIPFQLPCSHKFHVVLACPEYPQGFWSERARPFLQLIGNPTGKYSADPPTSVFSNFYSKAEAAAYLQGAGRGWPRQL